MSIFNRLKSLWRGTPKTLSSLSAYELWAGTYVADAHNKLMEIEQIAMRELMPDLNCKRVLDLACGTGRYGRIALEQGASSVQGVDNSGAMLQRAVIPSVIQGTSEAIPFGNNQYDVLICGLALGHLSTIEKSLSEISRVLTPDGVALISDFHPFQALSGAQRTFSAKDNRTYAVEHYPHLYSDYHQAAKGSGLSITHVAEPRYRDKPVVLVLRLQKITHSAE